MKTCGTLTLTHTHQTLKHIYLIHCFNFSCDYLWVESLRPISFDLMLFTYVIYCFLLIQLNWAAHLSHQHMTMWKNIQNVNNCIQLEFFLQNSISMTKKLNYQLTITSPGTWLFNDPDPTTKESSSKKYSSCWHVAVQVLTYFSLTCSSFLGLTTPRGRERSR